MIENEVTGRKYRILTNKEKDEWDRISFWTSASDVQYNNGAGSAEDNRPINIIKRDHFYEEGDVVYVPSSPKSWAMFVCSKRGQTDLISPSGYEYAENIGTTVYDGTACFTLYSVVPSTTFSNSSCQIPAMSLVNNIRSQLTAPDNNVFHFDYKDGVYGFTVNDEFHAFGSFKTIATEWKSGTTKTSTKNEYTIDLSEYPDAVNWDASNFMLIPMNESKSIDSSTVSGDDIKATCALHYAIKSYNVPSDGNPVLTAYCYMSMSISGGAQTSSAVPVNICYAG